MLYGHAIRPPPPVHRFNPYTPHPHRDFDLEVSMPREHRLTARWSEGTELVYGRTFKFHPIVIHSSNVKDVYDRLGFREILV